MTYHSDFWLGAITAAPVIALSHALVIERISSRVYGTALAVGLFPAIGRDVKKAFDDVVHRRRRPRPYKRSVSRRLRSLSLSLFALIPFAAALVGFNLCLGVIRNTLHVLEREMDVESVNNARNNLFLATLLVALQAVSAFLFDATAGRRLKAMENTSLSDRSRRGDIKPPSR